MTGDGRGMRRRHASYESRYKHKLNMLEPGLVMVKIVGAFFLAGVLFWAAGWRRLSVILLLLDGAVLATLLILLAVEAHQDKVLNEIAMEEKRNQNRDMRTGGSPPLGEAGHRGS